jgi:precorrin-6A/cobalt-precorrin-6A reductase
MIFYMAGTSDARELGVMLSQHGYPITASVVTEHAAESLANVSIHTHVGRLDVGEMCRVLQEIGAKVLVDASHPFAQVAHRTAMAAAEICHIPYIRYERPSKEYADYPNVTIVDTYEEAAQMARQHQGSIMLTTGSKTLPIFTNALLENPGIRLVVRLVPWTENIEKCNSLGIDQTNIAAIQGPFSREFNREMFRHYQTSLMITKESGGRGSVDEKIGAAIDLGIQVIVISRPKVDCQYCYSTYKEVIEKVKVCMEEQNGISH